MLPYIKVNNLSQFLKEIVDNLPGEHDQKVFDNEI